MHYSIVGRYEAAAVLVALGANVSHADQDGNTPLHLVLHKSDWRVAIDDSVDGSRRELFECIVAKGANVNACNNVGETPRFGFFRAGCVSAEVEDQGLTATELTENTPNERAKRKWQRQRLEKPAGVEKEHLVWALFEQHDADWLITNGVGQNLLHIVAQDVSSEKTEIQPGRRVRRVEFLMSKGLDPAMEDNEHRTPLDLAAALGLEDLLALFKQDEV